MPALAGEGLGSFEGWQTAPLNLLKRTLPRPQGLVGAAGKVCRGLSGAWELQGRVWRVLRAGKRQPWTSLKGHCQGLRDLLELQERSAAAWVAPGSCRGGFGGFEGWQTAALNVHKKTLPRPQGLVGAAGKVCRGLSGAWELQGRVWGVLRAGKRQPWTSKDAATASGTCWSCRKGLPRPEWRLGAAGEGLASFAGWQTAALNVLKRTLPGPQGLVGAAGKVCRGLSGAWELQGRVWGVLKAGKRHPWTSLKGHCHGLRDLLELQERSAAAWVAPGSCRGGFGAALNVLKKTLPRPQGLVGAAGKVCRGLSGAWELQGRVWRVLRAGKRQLWTSLKGHCQGLRDLLELQERSAAAWVAPGSCRGGFGEFCGLANGSLERP